MDMNMRNKFMGKKVAIGYIRCSTEKQEDSPEQQKKEIQVYADRHGIEMVDWVEDFGKSGTTFDRRPGFMKLVRRTEEGPNFNTIICYDESRFGRAQDASETFSQRHFFRTHGVEIELVKTTVDKKSKIANLATHLEIWQAGTYSENLSALTLRGAKNNRGYSNGGSAPYGFKRIAINLKTGAERELQTGEWCNSGQEKVKWVLGDPKEVKIVREIFEKRSLGIGCLPIARELNARGVPCPKRGRWRNLDQKWSVVTLRTIIENPTYYGAWVYNRNSMSRIQATERELDPKYDLRYPHWKNDRTEWVVEEGSYDAVVPKEVWERVNIIHQHQKKTDKSGYTRRSPYLLTGLMKCSRCGFAFQGWSGKASGKHYYRYIDAGPRTKGICKHLGLDRDFLETAALKIIRDTLSAPGMIRMVGEELQRLMKSEATGSKDELQELKKQLAENETKRAALVDAIERGSNSDTIFNRLKALEEERDYLKLQIGTKKQATGPKINADQVLQEVKAYIDNFDERFKKASMEERKLLVQQVISKIIVDREREVVQFYIKQLPALSPKLEELLQKRTVPTEPVSTESSGGRT
jgi:DNA invertase Pin-like site-specific DNA recombinase